MEENSFVWAEHVLQPSIEAAAAEASSMQEASNQMFPEARLQV